MATSQHSFCMPWRFTSNVGWGSAKIFAIAWWSTTALFVLSRFARWSWTASSTSSFPSTLSTPLPKVQQMQLIHARERWQTKGRGKVETWWSWRGVHHQKPHAHHRIPDKRRQDLELGWKIHLGFRRIPQLFWFWTFWTPEFSSEFYFSDCKMCSRQFWTHFFWFGILSCHWLFRFHELENIHAINVSGKWHQILIYSMHQLFSREPSPSHCSQYLLDTHKK